MQIQHSFPVAFRLRSGILFPELALDHLDLLAQIVLTLVLIHLGFELILDLVFDLKDLGLLAQQADYHRQAAGDVQFFQDLLLGLHLDWKVLRDIVCQPAGFSALGDSHLHVRRNAGRVLCILSKALLCSAYKRLRPALGHADHIIPQFLNLSIDTVAFLFRHGKLMSNRTRPSFDQNPDIIPRQAQDLPHNAYCSNLVQIICCRCIGFQFTLRSQKKALRVFHRRFQSANRHHPANVKMNDHIRKRRQPAQRQYRQAGKRRFVYCFHISTPHAGICLIASV